MKLSDLGEFGLIARFASRFLERLPAGTTGIGDDCAVLPWTKDRRLLVTTDMLVEDVHFLRAAIPARDLGYKSLGVNLSDIAAMGGRPLSAFLSLGIPGGIDVGWLDAFFRGIRDLAAAESVSLLGGDTTKSPGPLVINIAVLGAARPGKIKFRSGARPGDGIFVTGSLGDSAAGLRIVLEKRPRGRDEAALVRRHNRPRPHLPEGAWLAGRKAVTAMMDVSDGIDSDLRRILERSVCGAAVNLDALPLSALLRRAARKYGWDERELAVTGGEDYCLLAAVRRDAAAETAAAFERAFGRPLVRIGTIMAAGDGLRYFAGGRPAALRRRGFDHFRPKG
jgi:thiamine-monophosphate kinase